MKKESHIFIIVGRSCAGKDTIYSMLKQKSIEGYFDCRVEFVPICTTRKMRKGESNGSEYLFVSKEYYNDLEESNQIIDDRSYITENGIQSYFITKELIENRANTHYIMISTLEGISNMVRSLGDDIKNRIHILFLNCDDDEILTRYIEREKRQKHPNYSEICRRFLADKQDFSIENIYNIINMITGINYKSWSEIPITTMWAINASSRCKKDYESIITEEFSDWVNTCINTERETII